MALLDVASLRRCPLVTNGKSMAEPDHYLLGHGEAEEARLKRQIADLAPDSDAQFEKIGINAGERILDLGCGTGGVLHLLSKRVGPTGSVLGIERNPHFASLARRFVADRALRQVEVREGDAYDTGLLRASWTFVLTLWSMFIRRATAGDRS